MGLLNHLFGDKEAIAKELAIDENEKVKFWPKHVINFASINYEARIFSFSEIDRTLSRSFDYEKVLDKIESLISPELVSIGREEKLEKEIIADLKRLKSREEVQRLAQDLGYNVPKQAKLREVLSQIYNNWIIILHLIRLIRKRPTNVRIFLLELFKIICKNGDLYAPFYVGNYPENERTHAEIIRIAKAVIFNEEVTEKIEIETKSDEYKFVRKMADQMAPGDSPRRYRKLAESLYETLENMADLNETQHEKEYERGIANMNRLMNDDKLMFTLIKKLRPRYDDSKIKIVIKAFREAYDNLFFEDLGVSGV